NDLTRTGFYYITSGLNRPIENNGYLTVIAYSDEYCFQQYSPNNRNEIYTRYLRAGEWSEWLQLTVEFGENSNGRYWRWGNGLQICEHTFTFTVPSMEAYGSVYRYNGNYKNFPAAFTSTPSVTANTGSTNSWVSTRIVP